MNKEIQVSNELLSWVFGCECVYLHDDYDIDNSFHKGDIKIAYKQEKKWDVHKISIYQFTHLAKIKAFECGYEIDEKPYHTAVLSKRGELLQA